MSDIVTRLRVWSSWLDERVPDTEVRNDLREAADEIERLRKENATLTAERDALWRLTDRLFAEHDALRAERDEVRQSYCSLMEAYRGGDGRVTANKLGWGYLFEEDKP